MTLLLKKLSNFLKVYGGVNPISTLARHIAGSTFSCSLEYLLMSIYEHDLTLAPSSITHPDTFLDAYAYLMAEEIASKHNEEHALLGHQPDDR